jgi:hypothetical protein
MIGNFAVGLKFWAKSEECRHIVLNSKILNGRKEIFFINGLPVGYLILLIFSKHKP